MRAVFKHLKTFILRGFLAIIPLALSFIVLRFFYLAVDQRVAHIIEKWIGFNVPGLGFVLVLVILYLLGLAASNWAGRGFLSMVERISMRIPLVKTIYPLGKQIGAAMAVPEKNAFKRVVLVEHFRPGVWSIGFVTGHLDDPRTGERLLKLFVPQGPNPTSGFMIIVKEPQVREIGWSVAEAMNAVISGGLSGPDKLD
ncbi:MAG: DUF502 domain-containing protein [Candidatus Aminicenantes bacterium]|nr:DUF502 domain-containing protein [Candidatus Aminicenantes bacterium]